jgi:hypothetical protein
MLVDVRKRSKGFDIYALPASLKDAKSEESQEAESKAGSFYDSIRWQSRRT